MINSEFPMSIWTANEGKNWIYVEKFINRMYMNIVNKNLRDLEESFFLYEFSSKIVVLIVY